jgi:hypothetical protein
MDFWCETEQIETVRKLLSLVDGDGDRSLRHSAAISHDAPFECGIDSRERCKSWWLLLCLRCYGARHLAFPLHCSVKPSEFWKETHPNTPRSLPVFEYEVRRRGERWCPFEMVE